MQLNGTYNVKLGQSFRDPAAATFMTMRCDFMPASVDRTQPGSIKVDDSKEVVVNLPNVASVGAGSTVFRGSARPVQKECVLIFNKRTGELTLERIAHAVQLKKTREETQKPNLLPAGSSSSVKDRHDTSAGVHTLDARRGGSLSQQSQNKDRLSGANATAKVDNRMRTLSSSSSSGGSDDDDGDDVRSCGSNPSRISNCSSSSDDCEVSTDDEAAAVAADMEYKATESKTRSPPSTVRGKGSADRHTAGSVQMRDANSRKGTTVSARPSPKKTTPSLSAHRNLMEVDLKLSDSDSDEAF